MPDYLLTVAAAHTKALEQMLGSQLRITQADGPAGIPVAGLNAVTDSETAAIRNRFGVGGPQYHAGGPGTATPLQEADTTPLTDDERAAIRDRVLEATLSLAGLVAMLERQELSRGAVTARLGKARTHIAAAEAFISPAARS